MLHQIRQLAGSFTVGSTARIQLQRLGVDVEALDRELDGETAVN
jgi:formate-dependent phosphoribosylglycinamide formyltransferase (GAR transformylase)